jgi:hypothetical protein
VPKEAPMTARRNDNERRTGVSRDGVDRRGFLDCVAAARKRGLPFCANALAVARAFRAGVMVDGERYSFALKTAAVKWDEQSLDKWLTNRDAVVPMNNMYFHVARAEQRRT